MPGQPYTAQLRCSSVDFSPKSTTWRLDSKPVQTVPALNLKLAGVNPLVLE